MNKIFKYSLMLATATLVLASCKDDDQVTAGPWDANPDYQDVFFEKASFSQELDPSDPTQGTINLVRNTKEGEAVVPVKLLQNTDDVFTVDEVRFADGDSVTTVTFHFDGAEIGKPYTLELYVDDPDFASQYSTSTTFTYTVTRVKWNPAGYVEIGGERVDGYATYTDDFVASVFSSAVGIPYAVQLEERDDHPGIFRIVNAYGEDFPYNDPGDWDDSQNYYITINAEDPNKVFLEPYDVDLGFDWGYGMFFIRHRGGYYHANGDEDNAELYYGKYENGAITFPENSFYCGMEDYNDGAFTWYGNSNGAFRLVIDPSQDLYEPNILNDYTYEDVWTGAFQSGKTGESGNVLLQRGVLKDDIAALADEDKLAEVAGTPYRLVSPYADGYNLYFLVSEEGTVIIPEEYELQPIGRTDNLGTEIFAKISGGASTFSESEVVLNITFENEDGSVVYGTSNETFANITYTPYATGTVYYNFWSDSEDELTEDEGYTLLQRDDKKDVFVIEEWGMSSLEFTWNQETNEVEVAYQYTGYDHPSYGPVYMVEGALYNAEHYGENTSYYDPETKTFHLFPAYFVQAGSFGQFEELFVITDEGAVKHQATRRLKGASLTGVRSDMGTWKGQKVSRAKQALRQPSNVHVIR